MTKSTMTMRPTLKRKKTSRGSVKSKERIKHASGNSLSELSGPSEKRKNASGNSPSERRKNVVTGAVRRRSTLTVVTPSLSSNPSHADEQMHLSAEIKLPRSWMTSKHTNNVFAEPKSP